MKRLITVHCLLITLLAACSVLPSSSPTPLPTVSLAPVSTGGSNADVISASAEVVPLRTAQLSFPAVGRVKTVDVKVGDTVTAGQTLLTLDTTLLEARVREAEANLAIAQIQLDYLERIGTAEQNMDAAEAEVERAQALLDSAKATLANQSALTAPFDGTIVTMDVEAGETVVPGRPLILLADLSTYQVETTDLSEVDIARVKVGQTVNVSIEALGETFTGKVTRIALVSSTLGGDVVYTVTIDFDDQPSGLLWGMSADVEIQTE
ncbi:MAG: efflux RND transporter periplasmic adaptor subunit [Chloroflexota bacterium]